MTFLDMAKSAFPDATPAQQDNIAAVMLGAYITALRACSWRMGGIEYLFDGPAMKTLQEVIHRIYMKGGPL